MMRNCFAWPGRSFIVVLVCTMLLTSCGSTTTVRHYQLSAGRGAGIDAGKGISDDKIIGLGPILLPEYLDRPQIVTRASKNRLVFADGHRWAEPLARNLPRVLSENLSFLLDTDRILPYPWPRSRRIDCQVVVQVLQFETGADGMARLEVIWSVMAGDGKVLLPERRSNINTPAHGPDHEALVSALSETLAGLSREISAGLRPLLLE